MNISARHALCQPMAQFQKQRASSLPRGGYPRWTSVGDINARPSLLSHSPAGSFATPSVKQPSPARSTRLVTHASSSNLFPGGRQQAKVKLPALVIEASADEVVGADGEAILKALEAAVQGGATCVLLSNGNDKSGGAGLYDAACRLKAMLRGRAALLVADRTDIADAAEADGVILTPTGVPIGVARRLLSGANSLVGSLVSTTEAAAAAAEQGANLIILKGEEGQTSPSADAISAAVSQQKAGSIPVIAAVAAGSIEAVKDATDEITGCSATSGMCVPWSCILASGEAAAGTSCSTATEASQAILGSLAQGAASPSGESSSEEAEEQQQPSGASSPTGIQKLLGVERDDLVAQEKAVLEDVVALLKEVSPDIEEIVLLEDAIKNLDDQFLLVVVGEFNSGKSSFINAVLGQKFLAEGILPTTNEISILRWSEGGPERTEQDADGMYQRFLPAELLRQVNIVDTPGTNVVLQRQQRLTEEYIPRADLVLFVMSADRPFTESEVKFLKYIKQWGKKLVFVVNKADLLSNNSEVDQVVQFVSSNALELLGVDSAQVVPVSSRSALQAKLDAGSAAGNLDGDALAMSERWRSSGFANLETVLYQYLIGEEGKVSESVRLKMQTPLAVADALLGASQQQLMGNLSGAEKDLKGLELVEAQLATFRAEMERDSSIQREKVGRLVRTAAIQAEELVDRELQLSSSNLTAYMFRGKGEKPQDQPVAKAFAAEIGSVSAELQKLVEEHELWMLRNTERQLESYRSYAAQRSEQLGIELPGLERANGSSSSSSSSSNGTAVAPPGSMALVAVEELEPESVAVVLNEEVRESFVLTGSALAGAAVFEALGTSILPTTLEDILITAVAGVFAYLSVLNLPLRRAETKAKVQKVANNFAAEVNQGMEAELEKALDATSQAISAWIDPLIEKAREEVKQIQEAEARLAQLADTLEDMKETTSNMT